MESKRFGDRYVLRLEPEEEVTATIIEFARRQEIRGGYFVAFGAFRRVRFCYFDIETRSYEESAFEGQVEVVSLMGNIARSEKGEPLLHIHGAVGDRHGKTYSGHLNEGIVRPTLELFLTSLGGEIVRKEDPATGLQLLSLG